jgi:hypothetical protein
LQTFVETVRDMQEGVSIEIISLGAMVTNDTIKRGLEQLSEVQTKVTLTHLPSRWPSTTLIIPTA